MSSLSAFPSLASRRLQLRPLGLGDLQPVHALWIQPGVRRFLWDDVTITAERAAEPLRASERDFQQHGFGLWGLQAEAVTGLIGFCGLRYGDLFPQPELLFGIDEGHWGQGLAAEAGATVMEFGFGRLELSIIGAATDVPNVASSRVLEKLGMRLRRRGSHNGLDTLYYGMTREEWDRFSR